jgi:hypothetical protein
MKLIRMQVNYKSIKIYIPEKAYNDFEYMKDIKVLKDRVRYAVKENEQNKGNLGIMSWHFVSSAINNPSYKLTRLTDNEFMVERIGVL